MSEEKKGFVIKDRRMFSGQDGEPAPDKDAGPAAAEKEPERKAAKEESAPSDAPPLPRIDFATFIFSLNSSALVHLGVIEEPGSGATAKNLPLAKQTIDILGILEEKTRGNLTRDEESLLKYILHELRLMYVKEKG